MIKAGNSIVGYTHAPAALTSPAAQAPEDAFARIGLSAPARPAAAGGGGGSGAAALGGPGERAAHDLGPGRAVGGSWRGRCACNLKFTRFI